MNLKSLRCIFSIAVSAFVGINSTALAKLQPGDVYAATSITDLGAVIRIDPVTGAQTIISGPGVGSGPDMDFVTAITSDPAGNLYVSSTLVGVSPSRGIILKIDPSTGNRTIVSSNAIGTGIQNFNIEFGLHWYDGQLLGGDIANAALLSINPSTGDRHVVSKSSPLQGPMVGSGAIIPRIAGIIVDSSGSVIVSDVTDMSVLSIDPLTGDRTTVSQDQVRGTGQDFEVPYDLVIDANDGSYIVSVFDRFSLFRVDPSTGDRTIIFSELNTFPFQPLGLEQEIDGKLLVFEQNNTRVLRIDLTNNSFSLLSDMSSHVTNLHVVPLVIPEPSALFLMGLMIGVFAAYGRIPGR